MCTKNKNKKKVKLVRRARNVKKSQYNFLEEFESVMCILKGSDLSITKVAEVIAIIKALKCNEEISNKDCS